MRNCARKENGSDKAKSATLFRLALLPAVACQELTPSSLILCSDSDLQLSGGVVFTVGMNTDL